MTQFLCRTDNAPPDEVSDILRLLEEAGIAHYNTDAGIFGTGLGGIYIEAAEDFTRANDIFNAYQQQRQSLARSEYEAGVQAGHRETFVSRFYKQPIKTSIGVLLVIAILVVLVWPIFYFAS